MNILLLELNPTNWDDKCFENIEVNIVNGVPKQPSFYSEIGGKDDPGVLRMKFVSNYNFNGDIQLCSTIATPRLLTHWPSMTQSECIDVIINTRLY